jgi:peptidyl-tRNA hydrolase
MTPDDAQDQRRNNGHDVSENTAKQVIVRRKDLGMRKGKMIAQGAHASLKVLTDRGKLAEGTFTFTTAEAMAAWLAGRFTKVCVSVDSEAELSAIAAKARRGPVVCGDRRRRCNRVSWRADKDMLRRRARLDRRRRCHYGRVATALNRRTANS